MKLPVCSGDRVINVLREKGYREIRQRGSHVVMQKLEKDGTKTVIVPLHKELTKGTLRSIIRQAGLTVEEFIELVSE
ncbi:MAG: type II toxin-antitoxin system HicA family toxin [Endomicrobia bacterium]|nr:type II toxin-antitoxin system HicA family toxin [Endomicrobiia bacterium]MDW8056508.1 type II toxin-antitoxin system HicA family toxin [Elusimicrobiota bacterium]